MMPKNLVESQVGVSGPDLQLLHEQGFMHHSSLCLKQHYVENIHHYD